MVRGKFTVSSVEQSYYNGQKSGGVRIKLTAEYDNSIEEDRKYAKATPSGEIVMYVDNPAAADYLLQHGKFYVDFTAVPKPETVAA